MANPIVELLNGIRQTLRRDIPLVTEKVLAEDPRRLARDLERGELTGTDREAARSVIGREAESRPLGVPAGGAGPIRVSGLGDRVDALIAKSPTISANLDDALGKGFRIEVGPKGEGSRTSLAEKRITIDGGDARKPKDAVAALGHELGHVRTGVYKPRTFPYWNTTDIGSYADNKYHRDWVDKNVKEHLKHEADAIFTEIHGLREIAANGGPRIRLHSGRELYEEVYDRVAAGAMSRNEALDVIGELASMETISGGSSRARLYRANIHDILFQWQQYGDNI